MARAHIGHLAVGEACSMPLFFTREFEYARGDYIRKGCAYMQQEFASVPPVAATTALRLKQGTLSIARHWLAWTNVAWGVISGLPWLAPVLVYFGYGTVGRLIYAVYSLLCHQLADRSFFLFGSRTSYPASFLLSLAQSGDPYASLRTFTGASELGYKVAWSDRMVALYGGIFFGGLFFALLRRRLRLPPWWALGLLILPLALDGTTHVLSDLSAFNAGFRYTNAWLMALTAGRLGVEFYVGNALGSFNSWARLISGTLAGLAVVWGAYPLLDGNFRTVAATLEGQLAALRQR